MLNSPNPDIHLPISDFESKKGFKDYINIFLKRKEIILTFLVISAALSAIYYFGLPDEYRATARLLIGKEATRAGSPEAALSSREQKKQDADYFETQFYMIKSKPVIMAMAEQLGLPEKNEYFSGGSMAARVRGMIQLERMSPSSVVNLSVTFSDPELCARIANATAEVYVKQHVATKLYFSKEALKWFPEGGSTVDMKDVHGQLQALSGGGGIESLPAVENDPVLRQLKAKKAAIEEEIRNQLTKYKDRHPVILDLQEGLRYADESIQAETKKIADNLRTDLSRKLELSNIKILEYASVPDEPVGPDRPKGMIMAVLLGLLTGCAVAYFLDYLDNAVKSQEDVEKYVKLPYLGRIPALKDKAKGEDERRIIAHIEPGSSIAGALKSIRDSIDFSAPPEALKTLLITSTIPLEGKTFTCANLAAVMAACGDRTLLIDADMRCPTIHRTFRIENSMGLSNYLAGSADAEAIISRTFIKGQDFIGTGPIPPNPSGLLGLHRMEELIKEAASRYDRVIIDGPSLAGVSDSIILSRLTDGMIIVVRFGTAGRDVIIKAKQFLADLGINILGVVLNDVDLDKASYYSRYYHHRGAKQAGEKANA
ncbi:MAG: polysaccharide biosynthesis tyrosine autokinase [Candidatus Omnitrophota bacterium]